MRIRKLNRLKGYDYSRPGAYFITICVNHMRRVFGEIRNKEMILNQWGLIAQRQWKWLFLQYPYISIDRYIIMPDHMHGIIHIRDGARHSGKIKSIPELIGAFKTTSSKAIHLCGNPDFKWKKSYYDRIIRNEEELYRIRRYIENNIMNYAVLQRPVSRVSGWRKRRTSFNELSPTGEGGAERG